LAWLAANQEPDGRWSSGRHEGAEGLDGLATGAALLAFTGAGNSERYGQHRETVAKATEWIRSRQDEEGFIDCGTKLPYLQHVVCGVALSEAYCMSRGQEGREPVQRALDHTTYVLGAGSPTWGWGFTPGDEPNTLATCWAAMQMKSAKVADLGIDGTALEGAQAWFDTVTDTETGGSAFRPGGEPTPAMTATALSTKLLIGTKRRSAVAQRAAGVLCAHLPEWTDGKRDFAYWYFGTLATYQIGYVHWKPWNAAFRPMLQKHGQTGGPLAGSWDPGDGWSAEGGRVVSTAFAVMCLDRYSCYYIDWD
ncbi:MAG: prenyltransferase/squalene oxidase repeat-containing protein, partial [Planctomycetota bacterium]